MERKSRSPSSGSRDPAKSPHQSRQARSSLRQAPAHTEPRKTAELLERVFSTSEFLLAYLDTDLRFIRVNEGYARAGGHPAEFYLGKRHFDLYPSEENERIFQNVLDTGKPFVVSSKPFAYPDQPTRGTTYWNWSLQAVRDERGIVTGLILALVDLTDLKRQEIQLATLNRALRTLSAGNQALIHSTDEQTLFSGVCNAVVHEGGYRMAFIGIAEDDENRTVRPVAAAGVDDGYVAAARISWGDNPRGRGPTGIAIRTGSTVAVNDMTTDPRLTPWREDAVQRGYAASIAIPLRLSAGAQPFGALSIYAPEPFAFHADEVKLLEELADDIGFGISTLRTRVERERFEEQLRSHDKRFRALIEQAGEAVAVIGPDGTLLYSSPASERVVGIPAGELLGRNAFDLIHPDDAEVARQQLERARLNADATASGEFRFRGKDGAWKWIGLTARNLLGDPDVRGIVVNYRDVTERRLAQEKLRESEQRYRRLLDNNLAGVIVTRPSGEILDCNEAFASMLGYDSPDELRGTSAVDLYVDAEDRKKLIQSMEAGNRAVNVELSLKKKDGSVVVVLENAYFHHPPGSPPVIEGIVLNISELRRALAEREEMQRQFFQMQRLEAIGTLAGGIAHDFNNILGIILAHSSSLASKAIGDLRVSESAQAISAAVQRGANLVRQILTFARKGETSIGPVDVNLLLKELAKMLRETFPRTIEIRTSLKPGIPIISADVTQLHQAIMNICVNARDAMPDGGTLRLETTLVENPAGPGQIGISISDTGVGMDEAVQAHVFEPFFTTKDPGKGTGLGLPITYRAVLNHHGTITLSSAPGRGTTFHIRLPLPAVAPRSSNVAAAESAPLHGGSETILLVEDEDYVALTTAEALRSYGYRVLTARDGQEAVETFRAQANEISLVVSDLGLPRKSGAAAFREMRDIRPAIRGVFITGYLENEVRSELMELGASDIVDKPFRLDKIIQSVRSALDRPDPV